jgi:hypothetical protein
MSRYYERDDYEGTPEEILAHGRWEHNARRALKSKRGRQALRDLREALLALPEKRLIDGALCTVGGPGRVPDVTDAEIDDRHARSEAAGLTSFADSPERRRERRAQWMREDRQEHRDKIAYLVETSGEGVCAIGAYLWHQKVKAGADPAEAFAGLPTVAGEDDGDPLDETATLGKQAGLAYTLAWELAYRNDETYETMTPEGRYTAFLAWIDAELAEGAAS